MTAVKQTPHISYFYPLSSQPPLSFPPLRVGVSCSLILRRLPLPQAPWGLPSPPSTPIGGALIRVLTPCCCAHLRHRRKQKTRERSISTVNWGSSTKLYSLHKPWRGELKNSHSPTSFTVCKINLIQHQTGILGGLCLFWSQRRSEHKETALFYYLWLLLFLCVPAERTRIKTAQEWD